MPTQKSATAKLARKKFVIDRNRRESVTTKITRRFPGNRKLSFVQFNSVSFCF